MTFDLPLSVGIEGVGEACGDGLTLADLGLDRVDLAFSLESLLGVSETVLTFASGAGVNDLETGNAVSLN